MDQIFERRTLDAAEMLRNVEEEMPVVIAALADLIVKQKITEFAHRCADVTSEVCKPIDSQRGFRKSIVLGWSELCHDLLNKCGHGGDSLCQLLLMLREHHARNAWTNHVSELLLVQLRVRFDELCARPENSLLRYELSLYSSTFVLALWIEAENTDYILPRSAQPKVEKETEQMQDPAAVANAEEVAKAETAPAAPAAKGWFWNS